MMAISRAPGLPWSRALGRWTWRALQVFASLWVVLQIAYAPIHLYLEAHSDGADATAGAASVHRDNLIAVDAGDGDDHHGRHTAERHKFKVTQPMRAIVADLIPLQLMDWVNPDEGCPPPRVVEFSGLSPPELPRSWQFLLRAALPVRAPSLHS